MASKEYLGTLIRLRKFGNKVIIEYGDKFNKKPVKTIDSNITYSCYTNVKKTLDIGKGKYLPIFGSNDEKVFDELTDDVYENFVKTFFDMMDDKLEVVLGLVFDAMDGELGKYLTYAYEQCFDVLQYFADYEKTVDVDDYYRIRFNERYDVWQGVKVEKFYNIKRSEHCELFDYTNAELKKDMKRKNKFVLKFFGIEPKNKMFKSREDAMEYLNSKVNFVEV